MSDTLTSGAVSTNTSAADNAPIKPAQKINPVVAAYRALGALGLTRSKDNKSFRATSFVALASVARRELGKLASDSLTGRAAAALEHITTIERNAADCLPNAIGGSNPHHVRIGEIFASALGFAKDSRTVRNAQIADYVSSMK